MFSNTFTSISIGKKLICLQSDFGNFPNQFGRDKDHQNPWKMRIPMAFVSSKLDGKIAKIRL